MPSPDRLRPVGRESTRARGRRLSRELACSSRPTISERKETLLVAQNAGHAKTAVFAEVVKFACRVDSL